MAKEDKAAIAMAHRREIIWNVERRLDGLMDCLIEAWPDDPKALRDMFQGPMDVIRELVHEQLIKEPDDLDPEWNERMAKRRKA